MSTNYSNNLNVNNTMFYSTCDDGYLLYSVTSLLSIRDYLPQAKLAIISSYISSEHKRLLKKMNILFKEIDLSDKFYRIWQYPSECYYIFAGPELFLDCGYKYSVYVDGDILCCSNPLGKNIKVNGIAGSYGKKNKDVFIGDWLGISQQFKIGNHLGERERIHSGVVYFNNHTMKKCDLLNKAANLFDECVKVGLPRKGDDSLLTLFVLKYLSAKEITHLPETYNYIHLFSYNHWDYPIDNLVFYHFITDKPWKNNPYYHKNKELSCHDPYIKKWQEKLQLVSKKANNTRNIAPLVLFVKGATKRYQINIYNAYLSIIGLKLSLFRRLRNSRQAPIKIWWWKYKNGITNQENFGDVITADIIRQIYGYKTIFTELYRCQMVGVGSILDAVNEYSDDNLVNVWGGGFIDDGKHGVKDNIHIYGLRGKSSLSRVRVSRKVSLGDPGILANLVYKKGRKINKIGVVTHYCDVNDKLIKQLRLDSRFIVINPLDSPQEVAYQITACKLILSSSLHGLVFADSWKIPNYHLMLSDKVTGGEYKFRDYCSGIGKLYQRVDPKEIFNETYLKKLIKDYKPIPHLAKRQRQIIRSFPYY